MCLFSFVLFFNLFLVNQCHLVVVLIYLLSLRLGSSESGTSPKNPTRVRVDPISKHAPIRDQQYINMHCIEERNAQRSLRNNTNKLTSDSSKFTIPHSANFFLPFFFSHR